ncbi:MAG: prepilin-type N-terminal cleavage/methylation domain-containing protein [Hydrogenobacter sp.]
MDRKVKGLTLMELLITIAILLILSSFAFLWLRNLVLNQRLKATTDGLMSAYETARLYAITGRGQRPWGVFISGNTYTLFRDDNSNCQFDPGEGIRVFNTEPGVSFLPESGCGTITFDKKGYPRRSTCGLGMCSVVLQNSIGSKRIVYIDRFGRIRYETQ